MTRPSGCGKSGRRLTSKTLAARRLAEFYQKDDPIAVQLVDDAARALGVAIGGVVNFLSPEVIVVGGGVTGALWAVVRRASGSSPGMRFPAAPRYSLCAGGPGRRFRHHRLARLRQGPSSSTQRVCCLIHWESA